MIVIEAGVVVGATIPEIVLVLSVPFIKKPNIALVFKLTTILQIIMYIPEFCTVNVVPPVTGILTFEVSAKLKLMADVGVIVALALLSAIYAT
ncbi:hypothetical protein [Bacillus thuringiensis]|uniref:hypothetical protein n=1 Tax=Bacillus thuringiensis TaxID=1428 RepID=UPI0018DD438C|nr:hypothetical protein [Bacillus thuringiensis]